MAEFNLKQDYLELIKTVSVEGGVSEDEVIEAAVAYFLKNYFMQFEMYQELEKINELYFNERIDPDEIKNQIEEDKNAVEAALAEAKRLGLL